MTSTRLFVVVVTVVAGAVWVAAQQRAETSLSMEEVLTAYRTDPQADRADVIRKQISLTAGQAAKFGPLYDQYLKEQSAIMDEQMRGIQTYILNSESLDDNAVLTLINAHLDRDASMAALRRRYLVEFQSVLTVKQAARVIQVDRRISMAHQLQFTQQIPLIK